MPLVTVIIVNFNAGQALLRSVSSALASPSVSTVAVADNASRDSSLGDLVRVLGDDSRLKIHKSAENLGFARAVNLLARDCNDPYLLILNPDCELQDGAVEHLVFALESDAAAGLAGPWVTDGAGRGQKGTWRRLPDPKRAIMTFTGLATLFSQDSMFEGVERSHEAPPTGPTKVEAVSGACMLLRRSAFQDVGPFDEQYAMHCEDLDLMHRLQLGGFHCLLVPDAGAIHVGGVSSASRPWWVHRQKHAGMQRYFSKFLASGHAPPFRWLVYAGIWMHYVATLPMVAFKRVFGGS